MMMFIATVFSIWAGMHLYVFWRMSSVPWMEARISHRALAMIMVALGASYLLSRLMYSRHWEMLAHPLEFIGGNWIGILFLLFSALLVVDAVTLGGWLLPDLAPRLRGGAVIAALALSVISLGQGLRPPVVVDYEVELPGLPKERDGLVAVEISDTHLGTLIRAPWMKRVVERVNAMKPDLVFVVGDLADADDGHWEPLLPVLRNLKAPLGVWAVTGNHEYYAGVERSVRFMENAGCSVLRDRWVEVVPGLLVAGVDDLTARRQFGFGNRFVEKALSGRPAGATILLSHSPWKAETAAAEGAGLMLSGHTHNGQIWPFNYITRLSYPLVGGRYTVAGMPVIVCRGTGTWGSRMRLWPPSEIVRIRLKAKT
jgi:uncharacterized protein